MKFTKLKTGGLKMGIEIVGMQALLFKKNEMNIFGTKKSRSMMLEYLKRICHIGNILGAKRIVFGSPKNRDRTGLNDLETENIAIDFF